MITDRDLSCQSDGCKFPHGTGARLSLSPNSLSQIPRRAAEQKKRRRLHSLPSHDSPVAETGDLHLAPRNSTISSLREHICLICVSLCMSVGLPGIGLSVCMLHLSVRRPVCLSVLSVCRSVRLPVCLCRSVRLSVCLSVCLSVGLSVCPFV